jgi:hypothetical protein
MDLQLQVIDGVFAVCRLSAEEAVPTWAMQGSFWSVTKTSDELSIVVLQDRVPQAVRAERDWCMLKVAGPLDFALTGILSALTTPLAEAGVSIFAISTFDTDYLLVKEAKLEQAKEVLVKQGFIFI